MKILFSSVLVLASAFAAFGAVPVLAQTPPTTATPVGPEFVFFDWGKPELTGDAKAVLDRTAQSYAAAPGMRLRLEGHTDRSGSAAVNLRSARRRAAEVRDYLVAKGVPASAISVVSFGESRPLIATADGVREVQNRRVEIIPEPAPAR